MLVQHLYSLIEKETGKPGRHVIESISGMNLSETPTIKRVHEAINQKAGFEAIQDNTPIKEAAKTICELYHTHILPDCFRRNQDGSLTFSGPTITDPQILEAFRNFKP